MDMKKSMAGSIIQSSSGYSAYVPNRLPPEIEWNDQLVNVLSRADFLLGQLAREGGRLPNPHLLIRPFITREAVLSSKIEGTQATIGEVLAHDAGIETSRNLHDLQEVQNYIAALGFGVERLKEFPMSLRLIKDIHNKLMQGVRGSHATPGEFRKTQNWIGPPGSTLMTATYVPPPVNFLMDCLGDFESFLHDRQLPPLIHIALCHYQFEAIHPFLDGNGRVGRLLISFLLMEHKVLSAPFLYLSAFFEATRADYYRELFNVSSQGTWNDWLIYFLNGVAIQSEDVLSRAERINDLVMNWKLQIADSASQISIKIVGRFAVNPFLTISKIAQELGVAYNTVKRGVDKLEAKGIIQQVSGDARNKVYCATEILAILEEPAKVSAGQA